MVDARPRVAVVGDVVTDVLAVLDAPLAAGSDTPASIRLTGGGQGANTAAWLAWCGLPVLLVGAVGDDPAGADQVSELTRSGVRCAVARYPDVPTGTVVVLASGTQRSMIADRGANLRLTPADVDAALTDAPDIGHLHLSAYTLLDPDSRPAGRHALAVARDRGLTTSVDVASAQPLRAVGAAAFTAWVRGVDLLLANEDEAAVLVGDRPVAEQARALAGLAGAAVVKRGARGAVWVGPDGAGIAVPGEPVRALDPTGAGDAFAAGLLAGWLTGRPPAAALRAGAAAGAVAVTRLGARPPHPAAQPVE